MGFGKDSKIIWKHEMIIWYSVGVLTPYYLSNNVIVLGSDITYGRPGITFNRIIGRKYITYSTSRFIWSTVQNCYSKGSTVCWVNIIYFIYWPQRTQQQPKTWEISIYQNIKQYSEMNNILVFSNNRWCNTVLTFM